MPLGYYSDDDKPECDCLCNKGKVKAAINMWFYIRFIEGEGKSEKIVMPMEASMSKY